MKNLYLLIITLVSICSFAQENKDLKFVFSDTNPPFSYVSEKEQIVGLIPELVEIVMKNYGEISYEFKIFPWKRAQILVEKAEMDAFCTYPSKSRKDYAIFTKTPLLHLEYNYLIFSKNNSKIDELLKIKEINDLNNFTFVSHSATEWEQDNVPKSVKRVYVDKHEQLLHLTFKRDTGDFFIMNLEEAVYLATLLGYKEKLMYTKVNFIKDSIIPFNIGIRKDYPNANLIINDIEVILQDSKFVEEKEIKIREYQ